MTGIPNIGYLSQWLCRTSYYRRLDVLVSDYLDRSVYWSTLGPFDLRDMLEVDNFYVRVEDEIER